MPNLEALGWELVLEDRFDSGALDKSVWSVEETTSGNVSRTAEAVDLSDGFLTLTTFSRNNAPDGSAGLHHYGASIRTGWNQRPNRAGFLATYGYYEARIKFDNEPGTNAAFWTYSPTLFTEGNSPYGDPNAGGPEIDIAEHQNENACAPDKPCGDTMNVGMHWNGYEEGHRWNPVRVANPSSSPLQGEFHDYGALWTPEGYRIFIDGTEVWRSAEALSSRPEFLFLTTKPHDSPNFAGSIPEGGYGDLGASTNKVVVDHVKVWQRPISAIPDHVIAHDETLAVPFSVTDHYSQSPGRATPGSVRVEATSSNQKVIRDGDLLVTGNGAPDPNGSLYDLSFEGEVPSSPEDGGEWVMTPSDPAHPEGARLWDAEAQTGQRSLRLEKAGGRAEREITGLLPDTTYMFGASYKLELEWTDSDGNGRIGPGEPVQDGNAKFDLGITDTDASLPGDQRVAWSKARSAGVEARSPWSVHRDDWLGDYITFTTGPATTSVTVYLANDDYAGSSGDSNVSFDDVYLAPLVPADRTVSVRPVTRARGSSAITLTARDASGDVLGTEKFNVHVGTAGSFENGTFETVPVGEGWDIYGATRAEPGVVVEDPFDLNRSLKLAAGGAHTAMQKITGLRENTDYTLTVDGRVSKAGGQVTFGVSGHHEGPSESEVLTSIGWSTGSLQFRTGSGVTTATVVVLDWSAEDGWSWVDNVMLTSPGQPPPPSSPPPELGSIGEQRTTSGTAFALSFRAPGATVTGVESSNKLLVPDAGIGINGPTDDDDSGIISVAPRSGRTGRTTIKVFTNSDRSAWHEFPVLVYDDRLADAGFESGPGGRGWTMPAGATVVGEGLQRSGDAVLQLDGGGEVTQTIANLEWDTTYVLGGWGQGGAAMELRSPDAGAVVFDGAEWVERSVQFTTPPNPQGWRRRDPLSTGVTGLASVEVVLRHGDQQSPSLVDDLYLIHAPDMAPIREISTTADRAGSTRLVAGRVAHDLVWRPGEIQVKSSNREVMPPGNITFGLTNPVLQHRWNLQATPVGKTGKANIEIVLTDPFTGATRSREFLVGVNAGTFQNGMFQFGNPMEGWSAVEADHDIRAKRPKNGSSADLDKVLRLSDGAVRYKVTGLEPDTDYVVEASAIGSGVSLRAYPPGASTPGTERGGVLLDVPDGWQQRRFEFKTVAGETEIWLYVQSDSDSNPGASANSCLEHRPGEACIDDIVLMKKSPLPYRAT